MHGMHIIQTDEAYPRQCVKNVIDCFEMHMMHIM